MIFPALIHDQFTNAVTENSATVYHNKGITS